MMKNPVRLVNRVNFEKEIARKRNWKCEDMIRKYLPKEERLCRTAGRSYELQHGSRWKTAASDPDGRDISDVWRNIGYH